MRPPRIGSGEFEDYEVPDDQAWLKRFQELQVPHEPILEGLREGHTLANEVNRSHPRPYRGIVAWAEINASIRRELGKLGWKPLDEKNIPTIQRPDGGLLITLASPTSTRAHGARVSPPAFR